jgi:hypothetical protein
MILFRPAPDDARGFELHVIDRELKIGPGGNVTQLERGQSQGQASGEAWLVPWRAQESLGRGVLLLARLRSVRVNGRPALPVTVLRRGDEIRIDRVSLFFSDETSLQVVPFSPGHENEPGAALVECTRCHGPIRPGEPVVFCPACGSVYMAQADRAPNCWEFGSCLCCGRDPKVAFSWLPRASAPAQPWQQRSWRTAIGPAQIAAPEPASHAGGSQ